MKKYPTNDNNNADSNDNGSATTIIEPNSTWTIEQLLHWSLDQYHNVAMNRTAAHIDALRTQCENECEDIMTLHEVAVSMKGRGELMDEDNDDDDEEQGEGEGGRAAEGEQQQRVVRGENANPQQKKMKNDKQQTMMTSVSIASSGGDVTTNSTLTHQTTNIQQQSTSTTSSSNIKLKSSSTSSTITPTSLQITITSGPHTHQTFNLIPKPSQPCLIGRSKGKKFIKNGISLYKDQEVSTTHGKISVEHVYLDDNDGSGSGGMQTKFYYTDVGSTNGTTMAGGEEGGENLRLEPNVRMEIPMNKEGGGEEGGGGVELRLGNSTLKIVVVG